MLAVVVEELVEYDNHQRQFCAYCKQLKKTKQDMWKRELFMPRFLKKVHVVMVSDSMQFVIHKNLHMNLHYSISDNKRLKMLVSFCKFSVIEVAVYNTDTTYTNINNVVVFNNFANSDVEIIHERLEAVKAMEILRKTKGKANKRKTVGWSIGPSGSYAGGWRRPHPELDQYASNGKLCKEGFNKKFPMELKKSMAEGLRMSSQMLKRTLQDEVVFPSKERYLEFSKELGDILGVTVQLGFEGGTIQCYYNDFEMHLDTENCAKNGYQYSTVLCTIIDGIRVAWIGFTRERAGKYIERKRKAMWRQKCAGDNHGG